jgi:uncharacterized repeat protein (TIGR04138 family)
VSELQLAEDLIERIASTHGRYPPPAYAFVLAALEYCQVRRPARGHIAGDAFACACRDFALEQFGLTSRTVLTHWGIHRTQDIGCLVYHLIEVGLLVCQPEDRIEDFDDVFDFAEAFEHAYPWVGVPRNGGGPSSAEAGRGS